MKRFRWWVVAVLIAAGVAAYLNQDTWRILQEQVGLENRNDARMNTAEQERADLLNRKSKLESAVGREELARKQGYKKPGEKPLDLGP